MREFLLVFIGGGLGSVLRFILNRIIPDGSFPYSTLTVNMVGSFLIGIIIGYVGCIFFHNKIKVLAKSLFEKLWKD